MLQNTYQIIQFLKTCFFIPFRSFFAEKSDFFIRNKNRKFEKE